MSQPGPHAAQSACGPNCMKAVLQDGETKGTFFTSTYPVTGDVTTYISLPPGATIEGLKANRPKKIILWLTDVYGIHFKNNQLLMDWHASNGHLIVAPDMFNKSVLQDEMKKPGFALMDWIGNYRKQIKGPDGQDIQNTVQMLKEWVPEMKAMFGGPDTKYGMVGYCFGCPYVVDYCATDEISAGAIVHPAFLESDEAFLQIRRPLLASLAEQDSHFPMARRHALEKCLVSISTPNGPGGDSSDFAGEGGLDWAIVVYSGVKHGWALRGDMTVPRIKWAREESAKSVAEWWNRFL